VEVSAFQLWSTRFFPAEAGVLTNIAEDHYDHFDYQPARYRAAKVRLGYLLRAGGRMLAPLGLAWDLAGERPADLPAPHLPTLERFGLTPEADWGAHGGRLWRGRGELGDLRASPLLGRHNQLNLCAALGATHGACAPAALLAALPRFEALPHRMQLTRALGGVRWINDSKATNVHAALAGLRSVDEPLVVIAGGYEKGLDYDELVKFLAARARHTCVIGQVGPRLADALAAAGAGERVSRCGDLAAAVARAREVAREGDLVVLSPASSSFDQFSGFEDRGRRFLALVAALA
jgi:UDP-N-acetylmuramoylalanine--D-glutamate ligase